MSLITPQEVIALAMPGKNLDTALVADSISIASLKYIKPLLGISLYNTLIAESVGQTFTGLNQTLCNDYVKDALARYVLYEALPLMKAEITSNGIQTPSIDFHVPVNDTDFAMLRNKMLSDAELLAKEMTDYLKRNHASFPDYPNCTDVSSHSSLPFLY
ncbi:hypothetical protein BH09BAC1_BH09BAC1_20580 [soil metagenome]